MTSPATERRIGRYEIVREVGRGGTAVVYLARQADLDRNVALKELAGLHASDPAFIERFLRESRVAGSLNHPNIVTVHEYFEHEGTAFIAMEYFERGSLRGAMQMLTVPQVGGVLEGILAGLAHAHSRGIVHRDLKPENVMVTTSGGVKIADFGVAKLLHDEVGSPLTTSGTTLGTPTYMAPEQAMAANVGPRADLYAVGVLAYEMLAGEVPFRGSDVPMAIMLQHLNEPVPSLLAAEPELDSALCAWVERLLAKRPEDRPANAAEPAEELDEILISLAGPRWRRESRLTEAGVAAAPADRTAATHGLVPTRRFPARRRRRAALVALAAALALALAVAGAALAVELSREDGDPTAETSSVIRTTTTPARSTPEPTLLRRVALTSGDEVTARMRLTGPPLEPRSIHVGDADLSDGQARFDLVQTGISARTQGVSSADLRVRVRKAKNRLRVDLATDGDLARVRVRRIDGHTVLVTVSRPPAQVSTVPTSGTTATTTTTTQDATPPPKSKKDDGLLPSG